MDSFTTYSFGTAGWLAMQAVPLLLAPKVIITMLSPEMHETTVLEIYLTRSLALTLLTLATTNLLFTGIIPLTSSLDKTSTPDPYAPATVFVTMVYHSAMAFYCYMKWSQTDLSGFLLGMIGSAGFAAMGLWCVMFATGGHISRRTGKDKRMSGFPFKNVNEVESKHRRTKDL